MTRRLLILGETGFIGRHLTTQIEDRKDLDLTLGRSLGVDLRDAESIARCLREVRPDLVVNLAGISFVAGEEMQALYDVNAFGHLNLLQGLSATGFAGRLVFASSANVYGGEARSLLREDTPPRPVNHYACSKLLAEHFCGLFRHELEITIVRLFSCIGVGQAERFLVPKIARHFRERAPSIELGNTAVERDFIDVRDAARMFETVLFAEQPVDLINFCSNETHSIEEIIDTMSEISGHRLEVEVNPTFVRARDLLYQRGCDSRLRELGFRRRFAFAETLRWIYNQA